MTIHPAVSGGRTTPSVMGSWNNTDDSTGRSGLASEAVDYSQVSRVYPKGCTRARSTEIIAFIRGALIYLNYQNTHPAFSKSADIVGIDS